MADTTFPRLTVITGPEELLRDRAVSSVIAGIRRVDRDAEVTQLSVVGLEPGRLSGLAQPSLFGETAVIVARNVGEAAEEISDELKRLVADLAPTVALILVHHGGVKGKSLLDAARKCQDPKPHLVECKEIKFDNQKLEFVQKEFARAKRAITPDAAEALVEALGKDLRELASACSQLMADTDATIDRAVVDRYQGGRVEATGFAVADAAIDGQRAEALRLLRHALATGTDPVPINAVLALGLRTIARAAPLPRTWRPEEVARTLGVSPFQARKARAQAKGWRPEGLARALRAVAHADEQIKGGGADPVYALERAVITVVDERGRAE